MAKTIFKLPAGLENNAICSKQIFLEGDGRVEFCKRPPHDGPCAGDGLLKGYSTISVQEALMLAESLERLDPDQGIDLDESTQAWKYHGLGDKIVYRARTHTAVIAIDSNDLYDTAAGLVMAWLESLGS